MLSARVVDDGAAVVGQDVTFQVKVGGAWQAIPDDGMHATSLVSGADGWASVYYFPAEGIDPGLYEVRAVLTSDPAVASASTTVDVRDPAWSAEIVRVNPDGLAAGDAVPACPDLGPAG